MSLMRTRLRRAAQPGVRERQMRKYSQILAVLLTPTTYVTPIGHPHLKAPAEVLTARWDKMARSTFTPDRVRDCPLVTFYARNVELLEVLRILGSLTCVYPTYRFRTDSLLH